MDGWTVFFLILASLVIVGCWAAYRILNKDGG
jgi:uncharacterized protein YcfL